LLTNNKIIELHANKQCNKQFHLGLFNVLCKLFLVGYFGEFAKFTFRVCECLLWWQTRKSITQPILNHL